MKSFSMWVSALAAMVLLAGTSAAADDITAGKVKSINADKKEIIVTDEAGKDQKIKLGDNVVINRGGKESQSDLKEGDAVNVHHDKGVLTWTAHYVLVKEGDTKNCALMHGSLKGYDADKKQLTFTESKTQEWTIPLGDAKVRLNMKDSKIEDAKVGDRVLAVVEKVGDKMTVKSLMVERK